MALAAACLLALFAASSRATADACPDTGYSHVGVARARGAAGVVATVTTLTAPAVSSGHVAAWVGVGDRRRRHWLQVGVVTYRGRSSRVYVEIARSPAPRTYVELRRRVRPGLRLSVVAVRPGWWQAYVDGARVGAPVSLAGTSAGAPAYATTESWSAGRAACNRYAFRFDGVAFADRQGSWSRERPRVLRPPGARLAVVGSSFVAAAG